MRYITASIGAMFVFVGVILIGFVVTLFVPQLQKPIAISLGIFTASAPPVVLVALATALPAAIHSFRSTLKRYAEKAETKTQ